MKKLTILFAILFWFISCTKIEEVPVVENSNSPEPDTALNAVVEDLYALMDDVFGTGTGTRAQSNKGIASITPVFTTATRSAGEEDPAVYIVNFDDNGGYAIISTNPYFDDIISLSEVGNLQLAELQQALIEVENESNLPDTRSLIWEEEPDDPENWVYGDEGRAPFAYKPAPFTPTYSSSYVPSSSMNAGISPATYMVAQYIHTTNLIYLDHVTPSFGGNGNMAGGGTGGGVVVGGGGGTNSFPDWGPWTAEGGVPPLIKTKWDQGYPYNEACPYRGTSRAPAGCAPLAVAQIAAYHRRPTNYNWNVISNFGVWSGGEAREPEEHILTVAQFIYNVGSFMSTDYQSGGSGARTSRAAKYLRQYVNAKNVARHPYKFDRVKGRLDYAIPVYMHGFRSSGGGHSWIIDGYMKQFRVDRRPLIGSSSQRRTFIHINWGWDKGFHDGYYIEGVFDPTKRAMEVDTGVNDRGNPRTDLPGAYTERLKTLTWAAPN